jgi:hypothetical protein
MPDGASIPKCVGCQTEEEAVETSAPNGDHLRRWGAEHRTQLQRWADDSKFEQRPVPSLAERCENAARKYRDRVDSATHEIAAQLAGYADRRHFSRGALR